MRIYNNITELVGNTPLVKINRINNGNANIFAKLEYFNPSNSAKDRPAKYMIEQAEKNGLINKNTVIIEPTSGNTGIGLSMYCAQKGLNIILTMPESMSDERKKMLKGYGAKLVLTPAAKGMKGAVDKAFELADEYKNSYIPSQFDNPYNPMSHELTTAEEIFNDTEGNVDILVAPIGTGGTLCGCARKLKELKPAVYIVGVEPKESPLITTGATGVHGIQGIGANFIPENFDRNLVDEVLTVSTEEAIETAKKLGKQEGILCGISSGAAMVAALILSKLQKNAEKNIITILPDYGERYLSTKLFED